MVEHRLAAGAVREIDDHRGDLRICRRVPAGNEIPFSGQNSAPKMTTTAQPGADGRLPGGFFPPVLASELPHVWHAAPAARRTIARRDVPPAARVEAAAAGRPRGNDRSVCRHVLRRRAAWIDCAPRLKAAARDRVPSRQERRGGATNRRDCRSYACASASTRASSPGSPVSDRLSAGRPSTPRPAGTETSGSPSQLP